MSTSRKEIPKEEKEGWADTEKIGVGISINQKGGAGGRYGREVIENREASSKNRWDLAHWRKRRKPDLAIPHGVNRGRDEYVE